MGVTFKKSAGDITLDDCLRLAEYGVSIIFDEGQHVTFEVDRGE